MTAQPNPEQLKMFMTSEEIMAAYAPAAADRPYRNNQPVSRGGEHTQSERRTDGMRNIPAEGGGFTRKEKDYTMLSQEATWDMKRQEAKDNGLTDSVRQHGVVHPVNLSVDKVAPEGGKREVTGGHHRIVAAQGTGQFIPVTHHRGGVADTQKELGQRYR